MRGHVWFYEDHSRRWRCYRCKGRRRALPLVGLWRPIDRWRGCR